MTVDYTVGSLADMISGSSPSKEKKSRNDKEGMKIEYQELPVVRVKKLKKEKKNRKSLVCDEIQQEELPSVEIKKLKKDKKNRKSVESRDMEHQELASAEVKKPKKEKKKRKSEVCDEIKQEELPSAEVKKRKKEKKKRKSVESDGEDNIPKKKKKNVRITLPTEDENTDSGFKISNVEDDPLKNGADPGGFDVATLETQDNNNAKNARERLKKKGVLVDEPAIRERNPEQETRTIFVGNLSNQVTKINLANMFRKFGKIESVRLRSAAIANPKTSKKVAIMRKEFHPERTNINGYVRYASVESVQNALVMNGTVLRGHTIRVDRVGGGRENDPKKAVFVGNIQFSTEEEDLHRLFEPCGKIEGIRLIRDKRNSMGKGFAYVNFQESQSVELALKLDGEDFKKRPLRVSRCQKKVRKRVEVKEKKKNAGKGGEAKKGKKKKRPEAGAEFQGQEVVNGKVKTKKKKKTDKGELQKKKIQSMLHVLPKPGAKKEKVKKRKHE